uniref:Vacuolar protein sorting-associated protein 35 n=1 Tax=Mesocestoides corti TaxID=53468 RepID=A0A5K3F938_MESCO
MPVDDQEKLLDRAVAAMEQQKRTVKMYFDDGLNMDGLHCCANVLRGLRTSGLSPKSYYELYIKATEILNSVEAHLTDEFKQGRSIPHLYEIVQYVSNVLPRMYLLITVGVVYIKSGELPCREILKDLVEMCRGVQHPLRGLFLRNYLLTSLRPNLLPDCGATSDNSATVMDSISFILLNFAEMNKLWVRMQHQGHTRDREKRERERRDLQVLVGANIHRLSQLEAINADLYKTHILPSILEQVIQCRDVIAQEYLMDVTIQAFPDEFHAATLPQLLQACECLQPAARLRPIIRSLVDRLLHYISEKEEQEEEKEDKEGRNKEGDATINPEALFESLSLEIGQLVSRRADLYNTAPDDARTGLPPEDVPGLFAPLLNMAIYLNFSADVVNQVLLSAATALVNLSPTRIQSGSLLSRELLTILYLPLYGPRSPKRSINSSLDSATFSIFSSGTTPPPSAGCSPTGTSESGELVRLSTLLNLTGFSRLFDLLDVPARRRLACLFIARALERDSTGAGGEDSQRITSEADLDAFFAIAGVLVERPDPAVALPPTSSDESAEELSLLASVVHLIGRGSGCTDPDAVIGLLIKTRKLFAAGGSTVVRATFPTLVFKAIRLLPVIYETREEANGAIAGQDSWEIRCERVIAFCHQSATKLIACIAPDAALRLFLNCTLVIESVPFEKRPFFAYDFFSQAFTLFEQELSDARSQLSAFCLMVSTLCQMHCLDEDSFHVLQTQCSRAALNLLLRADQSRAVAITAQLYMREQDKSGVFKCLEKSRSLADMCIDLDARTQLYVDLLNYYVTFHQQGLGTSEPINEILTDLLKETEKLVSQLDIVPEPLSQYFSLTKTKVSEVLTM